MRDRMERLVLFPFSIGCVSESSVALGGHVHNSRKAIKSNNNNNNNNPSSPTRVKEEDEESFSSSESAKSAMKFFPLSKPNISNGFHRIVKSLKSFSQLFVYEEENKEVEMEIGVPTDVKHVTHIGWDGAANTNPIQGWDNLIPPELLSLQSPHFHTKLSMPAHPDHHAPLVN